MEVTSGAEDAFVREWTPCTHILNLIPPRIQTGIFSTELCLTCVDAVSDYIALGTNVGLVYWYDRKKGNIQRLRCEAAATPITYVKIVNTVDYMVGAGNSAGQVTVFQIPKEHPENIPDTLKPKVEPKVERYTISDLHKGKITAIEWSKNGMRLFSGDNNGVIIMTEIDFYMHLCKSIEIVNEEHEIVQMSYYQNTLLVSSLYRTIVCERVDGKWAVNQIGKRERKSMCPLGAVFQYSYARGGAAVAYCARPGMRLWRADRQGQVLHTLMFKDAISNPLTVAELLNPASSRRGPASASASASAAAEPDHSLGPLHVFRDRYLVAHNEHFLYVLDPAELRATAVVDDLRRILSVAVNKDEIFVLEGGRSLVRLAHKPEPAALASDDTIKLMTKSLTNSIQQAVNTVCDLTLDQTALITSVLEAPSWLTKDTTNTTVAEECFELPPVRQLPDVPRDVLESIINEFKDVSSEVEEIRRVKSEELQKKLKLYNSIMEKKCDTELIHSRLCRRRPGSRPGSRSGSRPDSRPGSRSGSRPDSRPGSGASTPRARTPACTHVAHTSPCLMNVSVYGSNDQPNDELLEKQIEEKEKILAKMLNLESLSITPRIEDCPPKDAPYVPFIKDTPEILTPKHKAENKDNNVDLVPKIVKLPNNWNLENIELRLEMQANGIKEAKNLMSPEDNSDSEWEIV